MDEGESNNEALNLTTTRKGGDQNETEQMPEITRTNSEQMIRDADPEMGEENTDEDKTDVGDSNSDTDDIYGDLDNMVQNAENSEKGSMDAEMEDSPSSPIGSGVYPKRMGEPMGACVDAPEMSHENEAPMARSDSDEHDDNDNDSPSMAEKPEEAPFELYDKVGVASRGQDCLPLEVAPSYSAAPRDDVSDGEASDSEVEMATGDGALTDEAAPHGNDAALATPHGDDDALVAPYDDDDAASCDENAAPHDDDDAASCDENAAPHDDDAASCDETAAPHDDDAASCDETAAPHDDDAASCDETAAPHADDAVSCDENAAPHDGTAVPHDDASSCDGEAVPSDDDGVDEEEKAASEKGSVEEGEVEDGEIEDDEDEPEPDPEPEKNTDVESEPVKYDGDSESLDDEELAGMSKRARKRYRKRKREADKKDDENEGEPKKRHKRSRHGDDEKKSPHDDSKRRRRHHSESADEKSRAKSPDFGYDEERNYEYDQYFGEEQVPAGQPGSPAPADFDQYYEEYTDSDEYYEDGPEPVDGSLASLFGDFMDKDGNIRLDLPERRRAKRLRIARGGAGGRGRGRGMPADILALARHGGMAVHKTRGEHKGSRPRRDEDPVCKVYKETGVCKLGIECPFSHDCLRTEEKRQEVCKFFLMDTCAKGDRCTYLHSELPCKYWHTGYLCHAGDKCKYSHDKLTEDGKALLRKVLREKPLGVNPGPKRPEWPEIEEDSARKNDKSHHRRSHREHEKKEHREKEHHREHKDKGRQESKDSKEKRKDEFDNRSKAKDKGRSKDKGRESKDRSKDKERKDKENKDEREFAEYKKVDSRESREREIRNEEEEEEKVKVDGSQEGDNTDLASQEGEAMETMETVETVETETVEEESKEMESNEPEPEPQSSESQEKEPKISEFEEREAKEKESKSKDKESKEREKDRSSKSKDRDSKDSRKDRKDRDRDRDKDRKDRDRRDRDRDRRDRETKDRKRDRDRDDHRHEEKKPRRDGLLGAGPAEDGKVPSLLDIRVFPDTSPPRPGPSRRERRGRDREWRGRGRGRGRGHRNNYDGPPFDGPYDGPYDGPFDIQYDGPMPYDAFDPMRPFDMASMGPPPMGPPPMGPWSEVGPHGPPGPQGPPMGGLPFDLPGVPPGMPSDMISMMATAIASAIRGNVPQKEEDNPYNQEKIAAQVAERLAAMKEAHMKGQTEPPPETSGQSQAGMQSPLEELGRPIPESEHQPMETLPSVAPPDAAPTNQGPVTEAGGIPDNLPPVQRQLMLRLQQNQKEAQPASDNMDEKAEDDNWYSSDEDESRKKTSVQTTPSLTSVAAPASQPPVAPASQPPANIMDILKTITKPADDGNPNPAMDRVLSLLRGARPAQPGASQSPGQGGTLDRPFGQTPPLSQASFNAPPASRDPRQRQQARTNAFNQQTPPPFQQYNSGTFNNQDNYADSPMSPPHTNTYSHNMMASQQQDWFVVQGMTRIPMKWNLIPCTLDLFNRPSLPANINPSDSTYKEDPRLTQYRNTAPLRANVSYNPATSFGRTAAPPNPVRTAAQPNPVRTAAPPNPVRTAAPPNPGFGDSMTLGGSGNFSFGQNSAPSRPPFVPPVPAALLAGLVPRMEGPRLGFEPMNQMNFQPRGPRPSADPRSRNDPRGKPRGDPRAPRDEPRAEVPLPRLDELPTSNSDVESPRMETKDPLTQMPKALLEPLRNDDSNKSNTETSDEERLAHRNDPRFKRRKSANTEAEKDPLVSRKRTMEYNSPLSGGAKEQSSRDAYSAYNRPRVRSQNNNNTTSRNSPVVEERSVTPQPLQEQNSALDDLDPDMMLGPDVQQSGSLKDVFNQIDPAASPFC